MTHVNLRNDLLPLSSTRRARAVALLLAAATLLACDAPEDFADDIDASELDDDLEDRLLVGYDATSYIWNSVVLVGGGCTGALIGERYVLTAGHCLTRPEQPGGAIPGQWYSLPSVTIQLGAQRATPDLMASAIRYNEAGFDDILLLELSSAVPASVATPIIPLTDIPGDADPSTWLQDQDYTMAGFGQVSGGGIAMTRQRANATVTEFPFTSFGTLQPNMLRALGQSCATVQPGDSGSPLIWVDPTTGIRHSVGVAQGVETCGGRYVVTFGEGGWDSKGNAKPDIGDWLETTIPVDFVVTSPIQVGCSGVGNPTVSVTVKNQGLTRGRSWVDVFVGEESPPAIGTLSPLYTLTPWLEPGQSAVITLPVPSTFQGQTTWIDVLLDTTQDVDEDNEANNHADDHRTIPTCSLT